ncbi:MAG: DUF4129 domain-containing protein [Bacteroidetes bacterium]|nr:MAG: DUF4129 domain-containing protein [Bacteroidota bacterium]
MRTATIIIMLLALGLAGFAQQPPPKRSNSGLQNAVPAPAADTSMITEEDSVESAVGYEDTEEDEEESEESDTAFDSIVVRTIPLDSLNAIKQQRAFAYMRYADSFFRTLNQPAASTSQPTNDAPAFDYSILKVLGWLLALGALAWLAYTLLFGGSSLFLRNQRLAKAEATDAEAFERPPPEWQIEESIAAGNYRQATRYLYLLTLQKLGQRGLVTLAPQKTNQQYQQELSAPLAKSQFAALTLAYEFIWFGEYVLQKAQFESLQADYKTFWNQWT